MRFQVPQFIEVEDKIFGPLTIKQFIYLVGGAGLSFLVYSLIGNIYLSLIFILPIVVFAVALAFYKINNKPFINVVEAAFKYFFGEKLYIWKKVDKQVVAKETSGTADISSFYVPKLSDSKLKDLTWSLDIKQAQNPAQRGDKKNF
jgi:cellulose synthase/poly-beta-1,6-N-acetylglucosamine synthase-like glycosyltransferase